MILSKEDVEQYETTLDLAEECGIIDNETWIELMARFLQTFRDTRFLAILEKKMG